MNRNEWFIAGGSVILVGIIAYLLITPKCLWFTTPVPSDILGDVSSWIMVGITGVTAYLLWHTLDSQRKVQQNNEAMLRIQIIDRKLKIRPDFDAGGSQMTHISVRTGNKPPHILFEFPIICKNGTANSVIAELSVCVRGELVGEKELYEAGTIENGRTAKLKFSSRIVEEAKNLTEIKAKVNILYEDIDGNKYRQYINYGARNTSWIGNPSAVFERD